MTLSPAVVADFPATSNHAPSIVADLKVKLVTDEKETIMVISWAINIDGRSQEVK